MHSVHALSIDVVLYRPATHPVQDVALLASPAPVMEPGEQTAQAVVDCGLYWPAAQAVHEVAPVSPLVFVSDPGAQSAQAVVGLLSSSYRPTAQALQVVPPGCVSVSVTEPAGQGSQNGGMLVADWPTPHGGMHTRA